MLPRTVLIPLFGLLCAAPALAGQPYLLKDINPSYQAADSSPASIFSLGQTAVFSAMTGPTGRELWGSDGTAAGTFLLADTCPGECSGDPTHVFIPTPGVDFFIAEGALWVTGGTPASTVRLVEAGFPRPFRPRAWMDSRKLFFFAANDGIHGMELWRTDGTPAGTFLVSDIRSGPDSSEPQELTVFKGRVFFTARDEVAGLSLWSSDGTPAGTQRVKDIWPEVSSQLEDLRFLRVAGGHLLFFAHSPAGQELWRSDGTPQGTQLVFNVVPGLAAPSILDVLVFGNRLLFVTGNLLWISDGTPGGTRLLATFSSDLFLPHFILNPRFPLGNRYVFHADDGTHGWELWVTDGTPAGTSLLRDLCPGPCAGVQFPGLVHQDRMFFSGSDGQRGFELWVTDGTAGGTRLVRDICRGTCSSVPSVTTLLGNQVIFRATDAQHGEEIWRTDGTSKGTTRISNFELPEPFNSGFGRVDATGKLLFGARDKVSGRELWATDGTRAGTRLLADLNDADRGGSFPAGFMAGRGRLFFFADSGPDANQESVHELWTSDGTTAGTRFVADLAPLVPVQPPDFDGVKSPVEAGGLLFFLAAVGEPRSSLYRSDGTRAGTLRLTPDNVGIALLDLEALGRKVFFAAGDARHGTELWVSDGTQAGTRMVKDLAPGELGSSPSELTAFGNRVFFSADDGFGSELWVSDGTAAGTVLLKDINTESFHGSRPSGFTRHGRFLYFVAEDGRHGRELWRTDGTTAGTSLALDLVPGPESSSIESVISVGSKLFLPAFDLESVERIAWVTDGTPAGTRKIPWVLSFDTVKPVILKGVLYFHGSDHETGLAGLWRSDGTEAGTYLVRDREGNLLQDLRSVVVAGGRLFITRGETDVSLWQSDGTPRGTFKVRQLDSGAERASGELAVAGGRVFFQAYDPATGYELWAVTPDG
ncbi:MAG TPA: ELWxxDGT repeat protein [Thermoanaerobaculia bacterium]|nr:ELWxxDGT repeat protein [Thermoanaerobaculia bacterium]